MLSEREQFIILLDHQLLQKADAIILLTGDGFARLMEAKRLLDEEWAPLIIISGGIEQPDYGSVPAKKFKEKLIALGVDEKKILLEELSLHTHGQAVNVIALAQKKGWKNIILVASHYHQYRAFLTFLKEMQKAKVELFIMNSTPRHLSWTRKTSYGKRRIDLLGEEFEKIERYKEKGHLASFKEAMDYLLMHDKGLGL